jgi:hypothetical protein
MGAPPRLIGPVSLYQVRPALLHAWEDGRRGRLGG